MEISSENSGPARSRSDDDFDGDREHDDNYNDEDDDNAKKKKRKKYHRHTAEQIREMEAYVLNFPLSLSFFISFKVFFLQKQEISKRKKNPLILGYTFIT